MSVVVWFDPGKTTGMAVYDTDTTRFTSGQYTDGELHDTFEALILTHGNQVEAGWELYIQTPRPRPGSQAKHSLGAIDIIVNLCEQYGVTVLKGQPSSARAFKSTIVFLRRLGWYLPGRQHANDAACHLFRHLIRQRPVPENIRKRLPEGY